jgi:deaminated glutathione amidase
VTCGPLKIATCQFAVSGDLDRNARWISRALLKASESGAHVAHFPEAALTGYPGVDRPGLQDLDWDSLRRHTEQICALAADLKIWVVLGSAHPLTPPAKPHNCLYVIGPDGRLAGRYDKRFCLKAELEHYTPGSHFEFFEIRGVLCSVLICFDLRFPELYRPLCRKGVRCLFQSFYNARQKGPSVHSDIMRQTMQAHAACNRLWVSLSNASGPYSPYASCLIQPDGKIAAELRRNRAGILLTSVDLDRDFYDPMAGFREMAMDGRLGNGPETLEDPRSRETHRL